MRIVDATPPADFPEQVIMMDRDLAKRHPEKGFYLRVKDKYGHVSTVDLDNSVTPLDARSKARAQGFEPTHWMEVTDLRPTHFY